MTPNDFKFFQKKINRIRKKDGSECFTEKPLKKTTKNNKKQQKVI